MVLLTIVVLVVEACRDCEYKGEHQPYLSKFEVELDECNREVCYCKCNGTAVCPPSKRYSICTENCATCYHPITNLPIQAYTTFSFVYNCLRLFCLCDCDGTYECPGVQRITNCETAETVWLNCSCIFHPLDRILILWHSLIDIHVVCSKLCTYFANCSL